MELNLDTDDLKEKNSETEPFETFLDCQKIEMLREEKSLMPKKMGALLGISKPTYLRIENKIQAGEKNKKHPFHSVEKFFKLAEILEVNPVDIVKPDCSFRENLYSIRLLKFKDEEKFNEHLLEYEKRYGRVIVFNTFPSSIYYLDDVKASQERYNFLGTTSLSDFNKKNIKNIEYYPINAVLDFALNPFGRFQLEAKKNILTKMIDSFSKDILGHEGRILRLFDPDEKDYYHDAPTCTIFQSIKTAFMPSPTDKNHLLVIRSDDFIDKMTDFGDLDTKTAIDTAESVDFLKIIERYISDQDNHAFITRINEEISKRAKIVLLENLRKFAPGLLP